jgi:hypothetical protein
MQRAIGCKSLDRCDVSAILHDGERQTRIDPSSFNQDRACTALTVIAALLRSSQLQAFAKRIEQRRPWRDRQSPPFAVDVQCDGYFARL